MSYENPPLYDTAKIKATLLKHNPSCKNSTFQWTGQTWQGYIGYKCNECNWEAMLDYEGTIMEKQT